jgi:hypothetical protein
MVQEKPTDGGFVSLQAIIAPYNCAPLVCLMLSPTYQFLEQRLDEEFEFGSDRSRSFDPGTSTHIAHRSARGGWEFCDTGLPDHDKFPQY